MKREKPVQNKLLTKKWRDKDLNSHVRRLIEMKASFHVDLPQRQRHLEHKPKKLQILEGNTFHSNGITMFRPIH